MISSGNVSGVSGVLTYSKDTRPPFIEAADSETFWDCMAVFYKNQVNERGTVTLNVENIIIGDKTYKGPLILNPEDIENKSMEKFIAREV